MIFFCKHYSHLSHIFCLWFLLDCTWSLLSSKSSLMAFKSLEFIHLMNFEPQKLFFYFFTRTRNNFAGHHVVKRRLGMDKTKKRKAQKRAKAEQVDFKKLFKVSA